MTIRSLFARMVLLTLVSGAVACNRTHLYKTTGLAQQRAFEQQLKMSQTEPRPRGLDGDEATAIITAQKQSNAPDETQGQNGGHAAPRVSNGGPPLLMLQSK